MKAGVIQQGGKENQRLYCRSNKRKLTKSPLKIRQKIKQLETKLQQKEKRTTLSKDKAPKQIQKQTSQKMIVNAPQASGRMFFEHVERDKITCYSTRKSSNFTPNAPQQKLAAKVDSKVIRASQRPQNIHPSPQESHRVILHKASSRTLASQSGQLNHLKEENERFKRIYSHSLEKMHELQAKLQAIRMQHEAEKWQLQGTMHGLKQKIEQKKVSLGHIYSHRQHDYLMMHDCIITETENESSSILENFSKRFQPSELSINSK